MEIALKLREIYQNESRIKFSIRFWSPSAFTATECFEVESFSCCGLWHAFQYLAVPENDSSIRCKDLFDLHATSKQGRHSRFSIDALANVAMTIGKHAHVDLKLSKESLSDLAAILPLIVLHTNAAQRKIPRCGKCPFDQELRRFAAAANPRFCCIAACCACKVTPQ